MISSGSYNTFLGSNAGYNTSAGARNVHLGYYSGFGATGSDNIYIGYVSGYSASGDDKLYIENTNSNTPLIYGDFTNDFVTINGRLGIGTSNFGDAKLAVAGTVVAKDIIVTVEDFPDYVFDDNYELLSLGELESYVKKHKHLPGIKPGAEIIKDGLSLGEMNVQILEKIEELTLHVIDMNKKTEELTNISEEIQKEIDLFEVN